MFTVTKKMELDAGHQLHLDYESKCNNYHGHTYKITVFVRALKLDKNGMVIDFTHIKKAIHSKLDHQHLNNVLGIQTTAENISKWCCDTLNAILQQEVEKTGIERGACCYKVIVKETGSTAAIYELEV